MKNIYHLFSGLHGFWRENYCHSNCFFLCWQGAIFAWLLSRIFLSLVFRSLIMICLSMGVFGFILSGYTQLSQSVDLCLFLNLGIFIHYFFYFFFSSTHFLLLFWDSDDSYVKHYLFIDQVNEALISSFFSLFSVF